MNEEELKKMKATALIKLREAEIAMYAYFQALPVGEERIKAGEVYDNIRNATRA